MSNVKMSNLFKNCGFCLITVNWYIQDNSVCSALKDNTCCYDRILFFASTYNLAGWFVFFLHQVLGKWPAGELNITN